MTAIPGITQEEGRMSPFFTRLPRARRKGLLASMSSLKPSLVARTSTSWSPWL